MINKTKQSNRNITKFNTKKYPKLRVIPLGGCEEVGRNMMVFEFGKDIIIVDMGLQFPEEDMPGIDYIIPNISYLREKKENIRGIIITHGHYDHIGAIPHLIPKLGHPPIYTTKLTAGIIQKRQEEYRDKIKINIINENDKLELGKFNVEFFRINHNIPDSVGVVIHTLIGTMIHTGDFKFDKNPMGEKPADVEKIKRISQKGILALFSDSTNAQDPGHQLSEKEISHTLEEVFKKAKGRIIAATFASLLNRVQQIISLSEKYGRKVAIDGRSMKTNVEIAYKLGYLKIGKKALVDISKVNQLPDKKVTILCTGAQGEEKAVLMRIANREHRFINVKKGDTVLFSSSVVPGNERTVQRLKDSLYREDANVVHYQMMDVHAGGHAKQEELKRMINLVKPKYFIPIEGNHFLLKMHADLAKEVGIPEKNIFVPDNGQIIEFSQNKAKLTDKKVPTNYVMVDGLGVGDVSNIVLRDRQQMSEDGMFVIIMTVDHKGKLVNNPDIISRGFVYMKESKELLNKTRGKIRKIVETNLHTGKAGDPKVSINSTYIRNKVRNDIGQFLYSKTKRRPMVLPVVIEV